MLQKPFIIHVSIIILTNIIVITINATKCQKFVSKTGMKVEFYVWIPGTCSCECACSRKRWRVISLDIENLSSQSEDVQTPIHCFDTQLNPSPSQGFFGGLWNQRR